MDNYIIKCEHCGKMFKITDTKPNPYGRIFITDYGDKFIPHKDKYICINCKKEFIPHILKTDNWIADLVFKIKGN